MSSSEQPQYNEALYKSDEKDVFTDLYAAFRESDLSLALKLQAFPLWVRRQDMAYFMAK